jgi:hypothetical protein
MKQSASKYPALNPKKNLLNRQKQLDYDYLDKLSPEEKQWLNDFTEEWLHTGFKSKRKKKNILKKKSDKKDAFDRNNARNRDIQNLIEMYPGLNKNLTLEKYEDLDVVTEDDIIELLDLLKELDQQGQGEGSGSAL